MSGEHYVISYFGVGQKRLFVHHVLYPLLATPYCLTLRKPTHSYQYPRFFLQLAKAKIFNSRLTSHYFMRIWVIRSSTTI